MRNYQEKVKRLHRVLIATISHNSPAHVPLYEFEPPVLSHCLASDGKPFAEPFQVHPHLCFCHHPCCGSLFSHKSQLFLRGAMFLLLALCLIASSCSASSWWKEGVKRTREERLASGKKWWSSLGNRLTQIPRYGNWCGKDYGWEGREGSSVLSFFSSSSSFFLFLLFFLDTSVPATDDLDSLCKAHDLCFVERGKDDCACDLAFLTGLKDASTCPTDDKECNSFRKVAIAGFTFKKCKCPRASERGVGGKCRTRFRDRLFKRNLKQK